MARSVMKLLLPLTVSTKCGASGLLMSERTTRSVCAPTHLATRRAAGDGEARAGDARARRVVARQCDERLRDLRRRAGDEDGQRVFRRDVGVLALQNDVARGAVDGDVARESRTGRIGGVDDRES